MIKRFEANNLQKSLSQFALSNNYLFNEDVRFIFNFDNSKIDLAGLKLKSNAMISGEPIYLNFNPAEIREVLNRYFLYHNFKKGNTNWTKNLDGFISELVAKDILKIETQNASTSRFEEVVNINSIPYEIAEEIGALISKLYATALMWGIKIIYLINLIFLIANVIAYIHEANKYKTSHGDEVPDKIT